jgi:molybdopterin-containing oxidoreductase family iron-sulfur binding subunit
MKPASAIYPPIDLAAIRGRLSEARGRQYWRSLEEVAQTPEFQKFLDREFPANASEWTDDVSRRNFLKLMGASLALAGLTACTRQPINEIVPYVRQPEEVVPGKPLFFATAMEHEGFATGLLVESHEGRPTKIEGNPDHPASLGATSIFDQASILNLYDPDRSQSIHNAGSISTWGAFLSAMNSVIEAELPKRGAGIRVLTETVTSPTLATQIQTILKRFPAAQWHQYQPILRDSVREGARLAFGEFVETHYKFEKARVILALDSDFLFSHPNRLVYARRFTDGRRLTSGLRQMNRLYAAESTPSITGTMADHRLPVNSAEIEDLARLIDSHLKPNAKSAAGPWVAWVGTLVGDLQQNRGAGLVIAGERQPAIVHALAHRMNHVLGNAGQTVTYSATAEARPVNQLQSLHQLVEDMSAGHVDVLLVLGGNPVFTAPFDLPFGEAMEKVRMCVHLSLEQNETSVRCHWHIPQTHFLETWSDTRAFDGTTSLIQPLIQPLYQGRSTHEVLESMIRQPVPANYDIVRDYWRQQKLWPDFEKSWRKALHDGIIPGTQSPSKQVQLKSNFDSGPATDSIQSVSRIELTFHPDPSIWDGRFANNGWLQELAQPISKLTWDNAALISPALAQKHHLANGDGVDLRFRGRTVRAPVWIMPGQAENSIALHVGNGRSHVGRVGAKVGFDAYQLRRSDSLWFGSGVEIAKTGESFLLATTQINHLIRGSGNLQNRDILFTGTLEEFLTNPKFLDEEIKRADAENPSRSDTLYDPDEHEYEGYRWGMAIDLTTCIGCNACVVACQSENNIPVVGKEQVSKGRDMLWIRIDSYFDGGPDNPQINHMPVPCMHCENAPCELVCPVGATVHDHEGLNLMVYNRCVGTRYCSNNCPYKVRRFNFLQYADYHTPSLKPMRNPNVTVRWRGVMEKCTYCIQRISAARITAKEQNRRIRDGEIMTACQQACPAEAIIFGDIGDSNSKVSRMKAQPLDYNMLGDLNTRPRTTYAAKVRNPNPEMPPAARNPS